MMRLFPKRLGGQTMEWISKLTPPIKSFDELVNKLISQYSYNIQHDFTMLNICNTKQKNNETCMVFLQRWRRMVSRYPRDVPEKEKMEILIDNSNDKMSYQLKIKFLPSFQKLIENGIQVEEVSIKKGTLKFSKEGASSSNNNTYNNQYNNNLDKSKFWTRNKNVFNYGVVDANNVKSKQLVLNLSGGHHPTTIIEKPIKALTTISAVLIKEKTTPIEITTTIKGSTIKGVTPTLHLPNIEERLHHWDKP